MRAHLRRLRAQFPAWRVPEDGAVPPVGQLPRARRNLLDDLNSGCTGDVAVDACGMLRCAEVEGSWGAGSTYVEETDNRRCSICLDKFVCGQYARSLPCSHTFHVQCIDMWLTTQSHACPEDGLPVLPEVVEEDGGAPEATNGGDTSRSELSSHAHHLSD